MVNKHLKTKEGNTNSNSDLGEMAGRTVYKPLLCKNKQSGCV